MNDVPRFAVVGHPNKGKSSIVATLAEDAGVAIDTLPGTTTRARAFTLTVGAETLYELIDTPGFQRPRAVLEWLHAGGDAASGRPARVRAFVDAHAGDARFHDECELLRPIVDGAGILYVVDGSVPYGVEYEPEMEILRWTGRPRMALVNRIGAADHVAEWRRALDQYFSIVREFDAQRADFARRLDVLRAFGEIDERAAPRLARAVEVLVEERAQRHARTARQIADLLADAVTMTRSRRLEAGQPADALRAALQSELVDAVRAREAQARARVEAIYRQPALTRREAEQSLLGQDLFAERTFEVFGLSRLQLVTGAAAAGGAAGTVVDAALGGASLLLGAGIGALAGGLSALFGADRLARVHVLGSPLGGHEARVGPIGDRNFTWVLLMRAILHAQLVAERNHARRDALIVERAAVDHLADAVDRATRSAIDALVTRIHAARGADAGDRERLATLIGTAMRTQPGGAAEGAG
jgi:hypothetical protein